MTGPSYYAYDRNGRLVTVVGLRAMLMRLRTLMLRIRRWEWRRG